MNLAQEDAARVHLVAAQLGHQSTTGAIVQSPVDQLVHGLVVVPGNLAVQGRGIFSQDR